jgi:hypothetical protein
MSGLLKMSGRVLAGRRIATADVAAALAFAQRHPKRALSQTLFASVYGFLRRKIFTRKSGQMFA